MTPAMFAELWLVLQRSTGKERAEWWKLASPIDKLWATARANPFDGFMDAFLIWYMSYPGDRSESFKTALGLVYDFGDNSAKVSREVTQGLLESLAHQILLEEEEYSKSTYGLVMAMEYALRTCKIPGWYPPTAYMIWSAANKNEAFKGRPTIAEKCISPLWTPS